MYAETRNLLLRRFEDKDLDDLSEYLSDEETVKFEPYRAMDSKQVKEALDWRMTTDEMIAVELKSNKKLIGNVYLGKRDYSAFELGYVFNKNYWGNGYAFESCKTAIQIAFGSGIHRIFAECDPVNFRSWRLLDRLGFKREAHFRKNVYFWTDEKNEPIWKDTFVYSLLSEA